MQLLTNNMLQCKYLLYNALHYFTLRYCCNTLQHVIMVAKIDKI